MKSLKKMLVVFLTLAIILSMPLSARAEGGSVCFKDLGVTEKDIVLLYTNDVHGGVSKKELIHGTSENCLGYAGLAAVKAEAEGASSEANVALIDVGDSIQGSAIDTDSKGQNSIDLMKQLGYDICVPGNHEFDFGVSSFVEKAKASGLEYVCANFTDKDGQLVLEKGHTLKSFTVGSREVKIGFVGLSTPESIAKGTPEYFQDKEGNFIYSFHGGTKDDQGELYKIAQDAIDACQAEGADYVVILGHMGDSGVEAGWSSRDVIAHTKGAGLFIDGHAHSVIPGESVKNKEGKDVLLTSTGTKLNNIGAAVLSVNEQGEVTAATHLINKLTDEEKASEAYKKMDAAVVAVEKKYDYLEEVKGKADFALRIYDKDSGKRMVRKQDTNMADFLTDGYLWYAEHDPDRKGYKKADLAILNGGSIRADIPAGDIKYGHILAVFPWATHVTEYEVSGQTIVDALEMGARELPDKECGGFITGAGLSYQVDTAKKSKVVTDERAMFVKVDGSYEKGDYRVNTVKIGGKDIDLKKTYTIMINKYYSEESGDGMTMFKGAKPIVSGEDDNAIDVDVIAAYLQQGLGGKLPAKYAKQDGDGRIKMAAAAAAQNKWVVDGQKQKFYYVGGKPVKGLQRIGKTVYLFDKNGVCQSGWHKINGQACYFDPQQGNGLVGGMRKIGKTVYLFDSVNARNPGAKLDG